MCAREVVIVRSGGSVRSGVTDRSSAMSRSVYQRPVSHHAVVTADTDDAHRMGRAGRTARRALRHRRSRPPSEELRERTPVEVVRVEARTPSCAVCGRHTLDDNAPSCSLG